MLWTSIEIFISNVLVIISDDSFRNFPVPLNLIPNWAFKSFMNDDIFYLMMLKERNERLFGMATSDER